jgi:hypothetical protein
MSLMKTTLTSDDFSAALAALKKYGVLLKQDKRVPNVVSIVTGESLRGSWWSHPQSHRIFSILSKLADEPAIALTKLLNCKDTFVHAPLWPALLAVGRAREDWQLHGLSDVAIKLLELVDRGPTAVRATGPAAKELQVRLLVAAKQVHTEDGHHELALESWSAWSTRLDCEALKSSSDGRRLLERATDRLGAPLKWLPWQPGPLVNQFRSPGS